MRYKDLHLRMKVDERAAFAALARAVITDDMAGQRGARVMPLIRRLCRAFEARPQETTDLLRQVVIIGKEANDAR